MNIKINKRNVNPKNLGNHWLTTQVNGLLFVSFFLDFNLQLCPHPWESQMYCLDWLSLVNSKRCLKTGWITAHFTPIVIGRLSLQFSRSEKLPALLIGVHVVFDPHANVLSCCILLTNKEGPLGRFGRLSRLTLKLYKSSVLCVILTVYKFPLQNTFTLQ